MRRQAPLPDSVAFLVQRLVLDREVIEPPSLPPVVGGMWGDLDLAGLWGTLSIEGSELIWEVNTQHGAVSGTKERLARIARMRNEPVLFDLADGTKISAKFGGYRRLGGRPGGVPGYTCAFNVWNLLGAAPASWVGRLRGGGFLNGNLGVRGPKGGNANHMRLEGNYNWTILSRDDKSDLFDVIIDGGNSPLDTELLGTDFNALQFVFAAPMQLETLVALDASTNVVGCAGLTYGGNRSASRRGRADGPVPDAVSDECWPPVLFRRLAKAMAADDALPWGAACNMYLDSFSDATIDGQYLKLHVALEGFAKALLEKSEAEAPQPRLLVENKKQWLKWVKAHRADLGALVANKDGPEGKKNIEKFIGKVTAAMNLPSSGVVADALSRLDPPLLADEKVIDELNKRNIPAHHGTMNKPGIDYEVDRDVERIYILRCLLVALVARACRYDGPIAGWVTKNQADWKPSPAWWPRAPEGTQEEARTIFVSERGTRPPTRARRVQSRLSTKKAR